MTCPHDITERDVAVLADGYCPLCMVAELGRLRAVVDAARKMPRRTPKGGTASTMHTYQIKACDTWGLDNAIKVLDVNEQSTARGKE